MVKQISAQTHKLYRFRILKFFSDYSGNWYNVKGIDNHISGQSINRMHIKNICNDYVSLELLITREAEDKRANKEYQITSEGLRIAKKQENLSKGEKYFRGID